MVALRTAFWFFTIGISVRSDRSRSGFLLLADADMDYLMKYVHSNEEQGSKVIFARKF